MGSIEKPTSGLQRRIAEGKADPISDLEREQYERMEQIYVRRFGAPSSVCYAPSTSGGSRPSRMRRG